MRIQILDQPELGEEQHVYWTTRHWCSAADLVRRLGDEPDNEIEFPVGAYGMGIPQGVPFAVVSTYPCDCCGSYLRQMFEWRKKLIIV